jgi:ElaB/YqjD/DUF883 family membrane-anchored ribosome-binding protein
MADVSTNPISQVGEQVKNIGAQMQERAGEFMHSAQETASGLGRRAQEGFGYVRGRASDYVQTGREQLRSAGETVSHQIQEKPLSSLLIACGVGFLLGVLWMRR